MLSKHSGLPLLAGLVSLLVLAGCKDGKAYQYTVPEVTGDGWETAHVSRENLNADMINALCLRIVNNDYKNMHSVLIVKNGKLVVEEYFPRREGDRQGQALRGVELHTQQSVTKSVNAILVGIAIDQQLIRGVEEKIAAFFPEYADIFADPEKDKLRLKHFLSMTALAWDESTYPYTDARNDNFRLHRSKDPVRYALERPVVGALGTEFVYNSGIAITLGEIVFKVSGLRADKFAERYLFAPLGISDYRWEKYPNGTVQTGGGLSLRPRDMAKIGQLFLHGGRWQGKQIVSEAWVKASTTPHAQVELLPGWLPAFLRPRLFPLEQHGYGYQWWLGSLRVRDRVVVSYSARGRGGQFIFVLPEQHMVAVFTGWNDGLLFLQPFDMMQRYLLPAAGVLPARLAWSPTRMADAIASIIFVVIFSAAAVGALVHLRVTRSTPRTRQRVVEVLLLYVLCVAWGFGGALVALGHIVNPDGIAAASGWPPGGPFQVMMGFAQLGLALLGMLSIWLRGSFWVAPAVGGSVFHCGAAYVHLRDGAVIAGLVWDIAVPLVVLSLLVAHIRLGGIRCAA